MSAPRDSPTLDAAILCCSTLSSQGWKEVLLLAATVQDLSRGNFVLKCLMAQRNFHSGQAFPAGGEFRLAAQLPSLSLFTLGLTDGLFWTALPEHAHRGEVKLARSLGWKLTEMICSQQQKRESPDASLNAFLNARSKKMLQLVSSSHG